MRGREPCRGVGTGGAEVWDMSQSQTRRIVRASTRLLRDTRGATMVEYAVLLFMILIVAAAVYRQVGKNVRMSGDKTTAAFQ